MSKLNIMGNILLNVGFIVFFLVIGNTIFGQTKDLTKETDPKVIKEELDKCKTSTEKIYKRWLGGSELIEEEYTLLQGCYTNFSNQIRLNEDHNRLISNLIDDDKIKDKRIEGGVVGLTYIVKNDRGTKLGELEKVGNVLFHFDGVKGMTFVQEKGNELFFRENIKNMIYKTLNMSVSEYKITITKGNDNNCDFRIQKID